MTDISTEPVVAPQATPEAPPDPTPIPTPAPEPDTAPDLNHTPGGYPVLPLALSSANTTASVIGAGGLAAGPVGAAAAAGGMALLGTVAALVRARRLAAEDAGRDLRTTTSDRNTRKPAGPDQRRGGRTLANQGRSTNRAGTGTSRGNRGTSGAGGRGRTNSLTGARTSGRGTGSRTGAGAGRGLGKHRSPNGRGNASKSLGGLTRSGGANRSGAGTGRLSQARALRGANRQQTPTRSATRTQGTQDRRAVADARRAAKAAAKQAKRDAHGGRGPLRRAAGWGGRKAASGARALIDRARARQDRATDQALATKRDAARKAPARRKARWALWRSAARMFGKRLLAGAVGGVMGLVGMVTSPIGRRLRLPWLVHPGRRLYQRLLAKARANRAERDARIKATRAAEEAQADADARGQQDEIADRVERPTHLVPHHYPTVQEVENVSGFKFEEAASEMQNAAATYAPDGNMEVVDMIDNLPAALECVAKTFLILAERSDAEFAFEKQVADGFDDIYQTLLNAVDAAVELGPKFREIHEHDIARHEDPRNGTEAEKGWNV
ncbi:hypothetical protein [Streptomyces longispororuber]|uniref:hypothetical protein n=1 Tax=Streptomyces longispororuber TaxID=68230 RepID=UPI00210E154A|nr:hypothetical protein [Streptomyces longispororuber]MCQ4212375.1 hypothetical protein [Streptomyces longispororuber]